jgi:hypothetical protein
LVSEVAQPSVAATAEKSSNSSCDMVMVYGQLVRPTVSISVGRAGTDCAKAVLRSKHLLIELGRQSVVDLADPIQTDLAVPVVVLTLAIPFLLPVCWIREEFTIAFTACESCFNSVPIA